MKPSVRSGAIGAVAGTFLLVLSCTRMPTAPPVEVVVSGRITGPAESPMSALLIFNPVERESPHVLNYVARADSTGMYSVRLPTGTYDVVIQPGTSGFLYHIERVEFTRSSTLFHHRFSGYVLSGTVRDPDGTVVDSGRVYVQILTPTPYTIGATDLIEGAYSFVLSEGTYLLYAESANYWSGFSRTPSDPISIQSSTTVDLALGGHQVTGTVLGPSGISMERVAVDAFGLDGHGSVDGQAHCLTGSDGTYRLWIHPGRYRFRVWPYDSSHIADRLSEPIAVQAPSNFNFDLAGAEWSGVVQWRSSGAPVPDVSIGAHDLEPELSRGAFGRTGSDGRFRLILDPGKRYDLVAHSIGIQEVVVENLVARTDTTFVILADPEGTARHSDRPTPAPPGARGIPSPGSSGP